MIPISSFRYYFGKDCLDILCYDLILFHRRAAKSAKDIYFMFAVEGTANIKNNPQQ